MVLYVSRIFRSLPPNKPKETALSSANVTIKTGFVELLASLQQDITNTCIFAQDKMFDKVTGNTEDKDPKIPGACWPANGIRMTTISLLSPKNLYLLNNNVHRQ